VLLVPLDLTEEERAVLLSLLDTEPHELDDAIRAVVVAAERRRANTRAWLAIRAAKRNGASWGQLSAATGYARSTLRDWAKPPATEGDDQ
jgi:hypothetical protein